MASKKRKTTTEDPNAGYKGPDCLRPFEPIAHDPKPTLDGRYPRCQFCGRFLPRIQSAGFLGQPLGIQAEPVFLFGLDTPPAQPRKRGRKRVDDLKDKWGKVAPV